MNFLSRDHDLTVSHAKKAVQHTQHTARSAKHGRLSGEAGRREAKILQTDTYAHTHTLSVVGVEPMR